MFAQIRRSGEMVVKLEGSTEFPLKAAEVWAALHDVDILVRTIPGCKSMVPDRAGGSSDGNQSYIVSLSLGVASIKGDYEGRVTVNDLVYPTHYTLCAEGAGSPGYVNMNIDCRLEAQNGGTLMQWTCDAEIGGLIASIGGRILTGISKYMAQQFFKALKAEMAGTPKDAAAAAVKG